jgi:hypothetical protein
LIGNQSTLKVLSSIKKFLGVIPIASTTDYYFSENDCQQIETIQLDRGFLDSVSIYAAKPLYLGSAAPTPNPPIVLRMGLSGKVNSSVPFSMADRLSVTCEPELVSTFDLLYDTIGLSKSQYFVPRFVPFSSPVQCESIFEIRTLTGMAADYYNDSLLNLTSTILGPVLSHYYEPTQNKVQATYSVVAGSNWSANGDGALPDSILINAIVPEIIPRSFNNGDLLKITFSVNNIQQFQYADNPDFLTCQAGDIFLSFSNDNNSTTVNGYACGVNISALPTQQIDNVELGGLNVSGTFPGPSFLQFGLIANSSPLILPSLPDRSVVRHNMTITINNNPLFPTNPTFTTTSNLLLQNEGYFATNNTCSAESRNFISTNLNYSFGRGPMPYYCTDPGQEVFTFGITTNTITFFTPSLFTLKF